MEKFCPITVKQTTEQAARLNAFFTVALIAAAILTKSVWPAVFLLIDFFIRGWIGSKYSLVCISSKQIIKVLKMNVKTINAGPKIFAAQVGVFLSAGVVACFLAGVSGVGCVFGVVLLAFSFLEGAFGICVACKLYPYVSKIFAIQ